MFSLLFMSGQKHGYKVQENYDRIQINKRNVAKVIWINDRWSLNLEQASDHYLVLQLVIRPKSQTDPSQSKKW
jgi:hypothetical protein